ncbi:MAG: large-conductance mechanosensitive channel protein MscL [Verrucomicrobia bacterium]|nr:large-conductance mechanosensitive channel protein MscL [Verrucomicrobiota bacterium]
MNMLNEFKTFAMRGNVVDLAVGIVIGGAFGKIVASLVADVIMPPIGMLLGKVNFAELVITLQAVNGDMAAVTMNYGKFIQSLVDFVIIALAIFMVVKGLNVLKKKEQVAPAAAPAPSSQELLLTEIRDLLKQQ